MRTSFDTEQTIEMKNCLRNNIAFHIRILTTSMFFSSTENLADTGANEPSQRRYEGSDIVPNIGRGFAGCFSLGEEWAARDVIALRSQRDHNEEDGRVQRLARH